MVLSLGSIYNLSILKLVGALLVRKPLGTRIVKQMQFGHTGEKALDKSKFKWFLANKAPAMNYNNKCV